MPEINIVVPRHLHDRLKRLAELEHETNGFFTYTSQVVSGRTLWQVHSFHMLGRGSAYHVSAHPAYLEAGNRFLEHLRRQSPAAGYEFLKVHTHCRGTGLEWFDKFSQGDYAGVQAELNGGNPGFTLMMFSPTHSLATGHRRNTYSVAVVPSTETHLQNTSNLNRIYEEVRRRHGIALPTIRSIVKRR